MKNKKKMLGILAICLVIIFLLILIFSKNSSADSEKIVETSEKTAEVTTQTIITTLTAPGEVQSAETEKITLNTSYYYLTMCAEEGEYVASGDNLLEYTNGTYVTAPYNCVVVSYSVPDAKEICTSSNYIYIYSVENLYMDINIGEDNIDKVSVGQDVEIVVNYDESITYSGVITKINAIGTHSSGGTTFAAIASLTNDGNLKLGMSATCTVTIEKKENLLCLPIEAVQIEDDRRYVNLVTESGETEEVEVETGSADANYVEIVSGLSLGDTVKYETTTVTVTSSSEETTTENALSSLFNFGGGDNDRGSKGGF